MAGDPTVHGDGPGPGVRDFAGPPSVELPPPVTQADWREMALRLADALDLYRKAERLNEAEIAALTAEVQRLRSRYEKDVTT